MQGLRTQDSPEFMKYWEIVQEKAKNLQSVYFLDSGEGREFFGNGIEAEDCFGWLIPQSQIDEFAPVWLERSDELVDDKWDKYYMFAEWHLHDDGNIDVNFYRY